MDGDLDEAVAGQSVTLTLADEVDCSRGDVIAAADAPPQVADQFQATIVWMAEEALLPGRAYWLKLGTQTVSATVQPPKYAIDVNTMARAVAPRRWSSTISAWPRSIPIAASCSNPMPTATISAASS